MLFATTLPLFCLVLQVFCNPLGEMSGEETRVNFGDVPEESYPSIVSLVSAEPGYVEDSFCGATLITDQHLLTAAHCYDNTKNYFRAVLGSRNGVNPDSADGDSVDFNLKDWKVNPFWTLDGDYDENNNYINDNAIITLPRKVKTSAKIQPIPLSLQAYNSSVRVVGWGRKDCRMNYSSDKYLRANGWVVDDNTCRRMWHGQVPIHTNQVCAQFRNSRGDLSGSDSGDSGGPLYAKNNGGQDVQIGVVSYSAKQKAPELCTMLKVPMIYSKVAAPETMAFIKKYAPGAQFI